MSKGIKAISIIISFLLLVSMLAACGSNDSSSSNNAPAADNNSSNSNSNSSNSSTPSASPSVVQPFAPGGDAPDAPAPTDESVRFADEIKIVVDDNPFVSMNPFVTIANAPANGWAYNLMFDKLVYPSSPGVYEPYLATRWETDDYQTFTFWLRDDVYFQNGEKFKASDVAWTIEAAREPGTTVSTYWHSIPVRETKIIDDYTIQIILENVFVDFLNQLALPWCAIRNEKAMKEDPENGVLIGTGAYRLTDFVANNYFVLERNDDYWGDPPITRKITMTFIPEMGLRTIQMLNNECQLSFGISGEDMDVFENNPDFLQSKFTYNNPQILQFNLDDPICGDYNFRMAIAYGINRAEVAMVAAGKYAAPCYDQNVWGFETQFKNTDLPPYVEDIEKAKEYLAKSSYKGETVEIAVTITTFVKAAEAIQQQLLLIGVNTEIHQMEAAAMTSYNSRDNNQSQMIIGIISSSNVASFIRNSIYPGSAANRTMYDNADVGELLDKAGVEPDYALREKYYKEIQAIYASDPPFIPLFWRMNAAISAKGVGGFKLPADARYDFRYIYWQLDD